MAAVAAVAAMARAEAGAEADFAHAGAHLMRRQNLAAAAAADTVMMVLTAVRLEEAGAEAASLAAMAAAGLARLIAIRHKLAHLGFA